MATPSLQCRSRTLASEDWGLTHPSLPSLCSIANPCCCRSIVRWGVQEKDWGHISHLGGSLRGGGGRRGAGCWHQPDEQSAPGCAKRSPQIPGTDTVDGSKSSNLRRSFHSHTNLLSSDPLVCPLCSPAVPLTSSRKNEGQRKTNPNETCLLISPCASTTCFP